MMGLVDASVRNGPPSSVTDSSGSGDVRPPSAAASAVSTPVRRGKREGAKNFTPGEDLMIAKAYAAITTDAAVGVDQDGETYYQRIAAAFHELVHGSPAYVCDRSWESIRNRWLNTLQKDLLKFVGCLNKAFAEDHSGWSYDDYFDMAKKYYLAVTNREFNRNCLWLEVKRLPKFATDINQMSPSSKRALSLDSADGQQPDVDGDGVDGVADQNSAGIPNLALAQRPSIGKKKAKKIKFEKEQTNEAPLAMLGQWMQQMAKAQEDRLSVAREKTRIARNKFLTSLFTEDDQEHSEFIRLQREQALLEARLEVAKKRNELAQWEERH